MTREIVYYNEMHTLMWQEVTIKINEAMLTEMLKEDLSEESKRELIQTYYICKLAQGIKIKEKTHYGAWNASIGDIKHIYKYEEAILEKIKSQVTEKDLENQFTLINEKILGLSEEEKSNSAKVQELFKKALGLSSPKPKILK